MNHKKTDFKPSDTTFYWSGMFLPESMRADAFKLYNFVQIVNTLVGSIPSDKKSFMRLKKAWNKILKDGKAPSKNINPDLRLAIQDIYDLHVKYSFASDWVLSFFNAKEDDLSKKEYATHREIRKYMYGSAEVVGLMISEIMNIPKEGHEFVQLQSRAMMYTNFIMDIAKDAPLGRQYIPKSELRKYGLPSLAVNDAYRHPAAFRECLEAQLALSAKWQSQASKGLKYVPRSQRIAVRTAIDMYSWVAKNIAKNPFIVFNKRIKPSKSRVVVRALVRSIHA